MFPFRKSQTKKCSHFSGESHFCVVYSSWCLPAPYKYLIAKKLLVSIKISYFPSMVTVMKHNPWCMEEKKGMGNAVLWYRITISKVICHSTTWKHKCRFLTYHSPNNLDISRKESFGEVNGNPLQCSCLENPRDGGALWAAIYGVTQNQTRLKLLSSSSKES